MSKEIKNMKKNTLYIVLISMLMTGCHFLDKNPDERADIDTQKKVQLLLVSGYEAANYGPLGELTSDNMIDNNTPDQYGHVNTKVAMNQMYDQAFAFEAVTSFSQQDSPYSIWQSCYACIAVANQALSAIATLEAQGNNMDAEKAEALLIRAYNHFILANIFCQPYKNDVDSKNDLGIHYMKQAETTVRPEYERGNVTELYANIKADLEQALPMVTDAYYSVPKYHFNVKAAYAFAAKFYLFTRNYDRCIECANKVLGQSKTEAQNMMLDAESAKKLGNAELELYAWTDAKSPSNLLLVTTNSPAEYAYVPDYARYTLNREARDNTLMGPGPNWDSRFPGCNVWQFNSNFGGFMPKLVAVWEFTDKIAGIGFMHQLRRELTAGETLLCRAEAEIMNENYAAALSDMDVWTKGYCCTKDLTDSQIKTFFRKGRSEQLTPELNNDKLDSKWVISDTQKPYIWCVLHLRRLETMHDGMRFWDIKRYGIELTHEIGYPVETKTLVWNDDRRAIQLPQEAILAGQQANPRVNMGDASSITPTAPATPISEYEMFINHQNEKPSIVPTDSIAPVKTK